MTGSMPGGRAGIVTDLSVSDIDDIYGARSALEGLLAEKGAAVRETTGTGSPAWSAS